MTNFNKEKLEGFLQGGQDRDAMGYLEDFLKQSLSPAERGEALVAVASLYIEAENSKNRQYLEFLDNAIKFLKSLEKEEKKLEDGIDLDLARHQIQNG